MCKAFPRIVILFAVLLLSSPTREARGEGPPEGTAAADVIMAQAGDEEEESITFEDDEEEIIFFEEEEKKETYPSRSLQEDRPYKQWDAAVNLGGYWENEFAVDTHQDSSEEDMIDLRSKLFGYGSYKFSDRTTLNLSLLTLYWAIEGGKDRQQASFDLYEGYLTFHFEKADIFVGQMVVNWGVADIFSPLDTVNPIHYRSFIDPDTEDLRIPLPMAKTNVYYEDYEFEVFYAPIFQSAIFEIAGTDFGLFNSQAEGVRPRGELVDPLFVGTLENTLAREVDYQEQRFMTGEIGARSIYRTGSTRIDLVFLSTREDFPVIIYTAPEDPDDPANSGKADFEFHRYEMYGLAYKSHFSGIDIRLEYAYSPIRHLTKWVDENFDDQIDRTEHVESKWQSVALEADYLDPEGDYFIKLGVERTTYLDAPARLLLSSEESVFFLAALSMYLMDDTLNPEWRMINIQTDSNSWFLSPRITYRFEEKYSLTTGLNIYTGSASTPGPSASTVSPLKVLSDNNQAWLSFRWVF